MFEGYANASRDEITSAAQPRRAFVSHPHDLVHRSGINRGIVGAVPETHKIARRARTRRQKADLRPAYPRDAVGDTGELTNRVKGDLLVVGAGLHRDIAARARRFELVSRKAWQIAQGIRFQTGEAKAIFSIVEEQARA